jgi:hypothetical protein
MAVATPHRSYGVSESVLEGLYDGRARPVNTARFVFLDPRAETSYGDWDRIATETVAILYQAQRPVRAGAEGRVTRGRWPDLRRAIVA